MLSAAKATPEYGEKQQQVLLAKKQLRTCSTLFLYISLPLFCTTATWNFQKLLSYTFYEGNVVRVRVHFFFTALIFTLHVLVAARISHFVTAATKFFMLFLQQKNVSFVFLSLALDLCCPFSIWASLACRLLSLFLCLSLALYSKFGDMTISLSLILWTTRIQKQFPLFVFHRLFSCLCFTRRRSLCDFPPK